AYRLHDTIFGHCRHDRGTVRYARKSPLVASVKPQPSAVRYTSAIDTPPTCRELSAREPAAGRIPAVTLNATPPIRSSVLCPRRHSVPACRGHSRIWWPRQRTRPIQPVLVAAWCRTGRLLGIIARAYAW